MSVINNNLRYTSSHEWVKIDGNIITMGITHHAQGEMGDIVFVELPEVDAEFSASESMGAIESVKTASEYYSPVDGKVVEINEDIEDSWELINSDCYGEGWLLKMEISDASQLDSLLTPEAYKELVG